MPTRNLSLAPFRSESGDFSELNTFEKIKHNILRLFMTIKGTDPEDPEYGADIRKHIFSLERPTILGDIEFELSSLVSKYEPDYVGVVDIQVNWYKPNIFGKTFLAIDTTLFNRTDDTFRLMLNVKDNSLYSI